MSPDRPPPNDVANLVCYFAKRGFADHMAMVVGPPPQNGIELRDDIPTPGPGTVPTFGSIHPAVCNFVFGDGSTKSLAGITDQDVLRRLCSRNDGEIPPNVE